MQANTTDPGFLRKSQGESHLKTIIDLAEVARQPSHGPHAGPPRCYAASAPLLTAVCPTPFFSVWPAYQGDVLLHVHGSLGVMRVTLHPAGRNSLPLTRAAPFCLDSSPDPLQARLGHQPLHCAL